MLKVKTSIKIKIITSVNNRELDSIIYSLKPDNIGIEKTTSIIMKKVGDVLEIYISGEGKLGSFIQTLDDLLRCLSVSIRVLYDVRR